jgi:hypothetical protein
VSTTIFTAGAAIFGFIFPELVVMLSPRNLRSPMGLNFACALAFGLLAYGWRA